MTERQGAPRSILQLVPRDDRPGWDRSADLQSIEATYQRYDETRRSRLWDETSPGYARLIGALRGRVLRELKRSVGDANATVLDLGCGSGELAGLAAAAGIRANWIGLDLREAAIEVARTEQPAATFMVASADDVPLDDDSVDVIVAQVLFSSLPSDAMEVAVAAEVRRLLRPQGWLVWLDLRYSNPANRAVHGVSRRRLEQLFPGWSLDVRPAGVVPALARRLGPLTPLLYPLLEGLPPLRSHLVGRLGPPRPDAT